MLEENSKGEEGPEDVGARLFQQGQYQDALKAFTSWLNGISSSSPVALKIHILFNRSACYLKLKQFEKVVEDCDTILKLEIRNNKALGRKIKALCSLGKFSQAQSIAYEWISSDPENAQAKRELDRLDIIVKALNDQDNDDDSIEMASVMGGTCERIPPDGQEDGATTNSPSNNLANVTTSTVAMVTSAATSTMTAVNITKSVQVVASSNNIPSLDDIKLSTSSRQTNGTLLSTKILENEKDNKDGMDKDKETLLNSSAPPASQVTEKQKTCNSPKPSYSSKVKSNIVEHQVSVVTKKKKVPTATLR